MLSFLLIANLIQTHAEPECLAEIPEAQAVCEVLITQQAAWNEGDIPGFMSGYWQSEEMRFASGGAVTYGWQSTLEGYQARYNTSELMGQLTFSDLSIDVLSDASAIAFGRFTLVRESDAPTGLFTLIFKKIDDQWMIVHDHTSSAD